MSYASQFLVFGEARNFCVALIALGPRRDVGVGGRTRLGGQVYGDLVNAPAVREMIGGYVDEAQRRTQPMGNHQEVGATGPRALHRARRADTVTEGQTLGGGGAEQTPPRCLLQLIDPPTARLGLSRGASGHHRCSPPRSWEVASSRLCCAAGVKPISSSNSNPLISSTCTSGSR